MTFREKLVVWMNSVWSNPHARPTPAMFEVISEASRLHEEEMAEKDRSIFNLQAEFRGADDEIKHQARENSQLREQLGKIRRAVGLAEESMADPANVTFSTLLSVRSVLQRAMAPSGGTIDLKMWEAFSPSSQREERCICPTEHDPNWNCKHPDHPKGEL